MRYLKRHADVLIVFCFTLTSLIVVSIWYKGVDFYGGGEEGLSLWRPEKSLLTARNTWLDVGLGYPSPFFKPRLSLYALATLLNVIFTPRLTQLVFFAASMTMAFTGVFLLVKNFVKESTLLAIFSGIFYVFNLYSQSQVFARFVFTGIFAWAFIPILLYILAKWLKEGSHKYLISFLLLNFLGSHTYSHPSYILIVWSILGLWYLVVMLKSPNKWKLSKRFFAALILWVFTNIWWIYPMLKLAGSSGGNPSIRGWEYDFATLQGLSRDFTNLDVFLLRQKYYFEKSGYWGAFYKATLAYLLSFMGLIFVFVGLFKKKAIKYKAFFVTLFLIGWFLSKGVNVPFGNIFYKTVFRIFPFLGMFRNSYEKIGVVFLLPYSIFFAVGVLSFANLFRNKIKVTFYALVTFFMLGLLVWPMWKGKLFSDLARVSIPDYYSGANKYIDNLPDDSRVLSLPFIPGEGVHYIWEGGNYYGLEPSEFLFDRPFVSWIIPNSIAGEKSRELTAALTRGELPRNLIQELGIGYVLLHADMDTAYSGSIRVEDAAKILYDFEDSIKTKEFEELTLYSLEEKGGGLISIETDCSYKPESKYKKINPGKYTIDIAKAQCPYRLILKTTYHDFWKARIGSKDILGHYLAYNYANGWRLEKLGDYEIDIIFKIWPWE